MHSLRAVDGGADSNHMANFLGEIRAKETGEYPSQTMADNSDGTAGLSGDVVQPPAQQLAGLIWTIDVPINA